MKKLLLLLFLLTVCGTANAQQAGRPRKVATRPAEPCNARDFVAADDTGLNSLCNPLTLTWDNVEVNAGSGTTNQVIKFTGPGAIGNSGRSDTATTIIDKLTETPPTAPSVALAGAGAGSVTNGAHTVKVTCTTAGGQTSAGTASSAATVVDNTVNGKIAITAIPLCSYVATGRKVYMNTVAAPTVWKLLSNGTIADNSTTTLTANDSDATLAASTTIPSTNTAQDARLTEGQSAVTVTVPVTVPTLTDSALTSGRVPIIGAAGLIGDDSDLTFATDTLTFTKGIASTNLTTPIVKPAADSTTAVQITKADGSTRVVDVDTTNARVGINKTPGAFDLDVNGAVNLASTLAVTGLTSGSTGSFSGSVAIGLTSPSDRFHVRGTSNNAGMEFGNTTIGGVEVNNITSYDRIAPGFRGLGFFTSSGTPSLYMTSAGNSKVGGNAARGTTEGTFHIDMYDGTAPVGTLTNGFSLYSASGKPCFMDSGGTANCLAQSSSPTFTNGTFTGTMAITGAVTQTAKTTTYNNIATEGYGVAAIQKFPAITGTQSAGVTVTTITPSVSGSVYRVWGVITTTSGTNTGTVGFTIDYLDSQATTHTADIMAVQLANGTIATTGTAASKEFHSVPYMITVNSGTAITLKTVIAGTVAYTVTGMIEQVR